MEINIAENLASAYGGSEGQNHRGTDEQIGIAKMTGDSEEHTKYCQRALKV